MRYLPETLYVRTPHTLPLYARTRSLGGGRSSQAWQTPHRRPAFLRMRMPDFRALDVEARLALAAHGLTRHQVPLPLLAPHAHVLMHRRVRGRRGRRARALLLDPLPRLCPMRS